MFFLFKNVYNNRSNVVKKLVLSALTISALCLGVIPQIAFAEEIKPAGYPLEFVGTWDNLSSELENLGDYAVGENGVAFSSGDKIFVYSGNFSSENAALVGEIEIISCEEEVAALEFDGEYYYKDIDGGLFALSNPSTPYDGEVEFQKVEFLKFGEYRYIAEGGVVYTYSASPLDVTKVLTDDGEELRNLKQYGERAYACTNSAIYVLSGATAEKLDFKYADYSLTETIPLNGIAAEIKELSAQTAVFKDGAYVTEVDLTKLDGEFFAANSSTTEEVSPAESCLVLYNSVENGVAVVLRKGKTYLTSPASFEEIVDISLNESGFAKANTLWEIGVYSKPYVSGVTRIGTLSQGAEVTVKGVLKGGELDCDFYEIEYEADGETLTGYITVGYLQPASGETPPPTGGDEDNYNEDNKVRTVVLVLIVVALVVIAIVYLIFVATSPRRSKKKDDEPFKNE